MYTVAQVLSPEFARSWHEAVAIVQAAAELLQPGVALPGPEDLVLEEAGALTFGFGSESNDDPVVALSGLLIRLLDGVEAPESLRDFAIENSRPSATAKSLGDFTGGLSFYERPNRPNDLRSIVSRLRSTRPKSQLDEEFERLREKVASVEEAKPKEQERRRKPKLSKRDQIIAVAAVVLLVFGTLGYKSGAFRNLGAVGGSLESGIQSVVSAGLEALGTSKAASTASGKPAEGTAADGGPVETGATTQSGKAGTATKSNSPSKPEHASRPSVIATSGAGSASKDPAALDARTPSAGASLPGVKAYPEPQGSSVRPGAPRGRTNGFNAIDVIPAPPTSVSTQVYSTDDAGVQAPTLIRPQLPREPAPGSDTGYFDITVDEQGNVAEIKLISPRRKYHDRMLVSAAKAWKFRPATLNGQPVKYRLRVPIILSGMPGS